MGSTKATPFNNSKSEFSDPVIINTTTSGKSTDNNVGGSHHFFTEGIIRKPDLRLSTSPLAANNGPIYFQKDSEETLLKFNSVYLWDKSKSQSSGECSLPSAESNGNYKGSGTTETAASPSFHSTEEKSRFSLYDQAVNFANQVGSWNRKFGPVWSPLLTYPSDLHRIGRTALMTAVTGYVLARTLDQLVTGADLQQLSYLLSKVLEHNLLDGTDAIDPGRVGVNKDFIS